MLGTMVHVYHESAEYLAGLIRTIAPELEVIALKTPVALRTALPEIEILFAPSPPRDGWAGADKLRLVQLLGSGVDQLLPSPDLPAHVEVAGVRGLFAADVAEHALALLLAHVRKLTQLVDDQRAKRFEPTPRGTLAGEKLLVVGHGEVGRRLARAAVALAMRVSAVSRTGENPEPGVELLTPEWLTSEVETARFIVIACPLTPATMHLFSAAMIGRLRPDAFLINVARGGIVDESALADALSAGRIAGAALDVFADEPLSPDSALWNVPRLVITPHVAGLGERYIERCIDVLLGNVTALATGAPRTGVVRRDVGY